MRISDFLSFLRGAKKTRLCIIGNSHAVAYKLALEADAALSRKYEATYFLAAGRQLKLEPVEGRLAVRDTAIEKVARYSGGLTEIDTAAYDAFIIVGLLLHFRRVVDIYATHRLREHAGEDFRIISEEFLHRSSYDGLARSPAVRIYRQIRAMTSAPCVLVPDPLPSEAIRTGAETRELWSGTFIPGLHELYRKHLGKISSRDKVDIVEQPAELIVDRCFTPERYSRGSISLKESAHGEGENFHMNADFGAKMLPLVLRSLSPR